MISTRQLFLQHVAQTSDAPLALSFEKAEGVFLHTTDGKKIMDLISGIGVSNLGHSHPEIVAAVKAQAEKYMHLMVYGEFVQSPQVALATMLTSLLPASLNSVYFTNSGAEATEGAMKLAKRHTGRADFIHFKNAYHGSTQGALSVLGDEYFKQNYRPLLPNIHTLEYNNIDDLYAINEHTAAVIVDVVQAESGITVGTIDFIQSLRKKCDENGALLIIDEAQTGMGRIGSLFGFEQYGIVPDILLLAKAFGGGMPLGAFIADKKIMNDLTHNPVLGHITTFGGHPVSCAAALASLKVLQESNLIATVEEKGILFEKKLVHPAIQKITQKGLMIALHFDCFETNKKIIDECIQNGVLTDWFLFAPHCLRICPPLIITNEQIDAACDIILAAINKICVS